MAYISVGYSGILIEPPFVNYAKIMFYGMKLLFILLLAGLLASPAQAQKAFNPEIRQKALQSADGYRLRTNDDRYEGLYKLQVGAPLLDVVSVTQGAISYELSDKGKLYITAPRLTAYKEIGISGNSFKLDWNYRLDALLKANTTKTVPMKEVLRPRSIYADNLGVFGYIGEPQAPTLYVPVSVTTVQSKSAGPDMVQIVLLPGTRLDKMNWQFAPATQGKCQNYRPGKLPSGTGRFAALVPIMLELPFGHNNEPAYSSEVCVEVNYQAAGSSEWHTRTLRVLLPAK